ncbi:MAG: GHKL domain-containing protein [Chloroflexi bacterium]|nr:GHKL domain-containing protein [Chloroflexota bacterium]
MIDNPTQALALFDEFGIAAIYCDNNGCIKNINPVAQTLFHFPPEISGRRLTEVKGLRILASLDFSAEFHEVALYDRLFCRVRMKPTALGGLIFTFEDISYFHDHDQLRTDVLYMVVHDLRTPISAIKSYAELVTQVGAVTPQQLQFLQRVQQAVRSTNMLLNDLLDITWIDSGVSLDRQRVNIGYLAQATLESLEERAKSHGVSLHISVGPDLPLVIGEPHRLERVFNNLIINAIKYSGKGKSVYVTVSQAGHFVTVAVADNGIGIPDDHLPFIFDRFYRVPSEEHQEHRKEGMGLGLAIVKAIVEKHGGHVEVQSEVGQGSTFMVVLPIGEG